MVLSYWEEMTRGSGPRPILVGYPHRCLVLTERRGHWQSVLLLKGFYMRQINPDHVERLLQAINAAPYFQLLSMRIRELSLGYSVFEIDVSENAFQLGFIFFFNLLKGDIYYLADVGFISVFILS